MKRIKKINVIYISIFVMITASCTKESVIEGYTKSPSYNSLENNTILANNTKYKIIDAYKSSYINTLCNGAGIVGSFGFVGVNTSTNDTLDFSLYNLTSFSTSLNFTMYNYTNCNFKGIIIKQNNVSNEYFYSKGNGSFTITNNRFQINNAEFFNNITNTAITINCNGTY